MSTFRDSKTRVWTIKMSLCNWRYLKTVSLYIQSLIYYLPSVLWHCWLGDRKGIRPVKKLSGGMLAWLCVWVKVQTCIWPSWCHCHSLSPAHAVNLDWFYLPGFTFLVPAHRVVPDKTQESRKTVVYACICVLLLARFLSHLKLPRLSRHITKVKYLIQLIIDQFHT